jgi:hypothetical protein
MLTLIACYFYKPIKMTPPSVDPAALNPYLSKVFIYHSDTNIYHLDNVKLQPETGDISGILKSVDPVHQTYINDKKKKYAYKPSLSLVINEVHLYGSLDSHNRIGDTVRIALRNIEKMEVIERDKLRSTVTTVFTVIGVAAGIGAIVTGIALATKESCPFISVYDGNNYLLQGETFGGAVYPSLARADFVPLPAAAIGREVKMMISNELQERQYTDFADLLLVEHTPGKKIFITPDGAFFQVKQVMAPQAARLNKNHDVTNVLRETDNNTCAFNDTTFNSPVNRLEIKFSHPGSTEKACLILDLRSSQWLDYTYNQATSKLGSNYNAWVAQQKQLPASAHIAWQEMQHLPLTIYLNDSQGWREIFSLKTIGPLMNREVAIPLDKLPAGQEIEIALSTGFMFWELDRAQLATVESVPADNVKTIKPSAAKDEAGNNVLDLLMHADGSYLEQHKNGNRAYLTYKVPGYSKAKAYSAFLHSYGYYEPIREFTGLTDTAFLEAMMKPGAFTDFSRNRYQELISMANLAAQ